MTSRTTANITHINEISSSHLYSSFQQLNIRYEEQHKLQWCFINPTPNPCFNTIVLSELNTMLEQLKAEASSNPERVKYHAFSSELSGIFNTGGDLSLFKQYILSKNREALAQYGYACIGAIHHSCTLHQSGITEIAVVQGDALGGGFECVLSADVIIAEKSAKMGFPEVLFNLFPGMGAYSFLSRKLTPIQAEKMIISGKLYSAEELYELGVVDMVVEDSHGETAVYDYIQKEDRSRNTLQSIRKVKDRCNPIAWEELKDIVDIWVESALKLGKKDLRMMERLMCKQKGSFSNYA